MCSSNKRFLLISIIIFILFVTFACAPPPYRKHPEFETRSTAVGNPGLIPPDIKIYELTAGGLHELRDDWSEIGKENCLSSVTECLKEKNCPTECLAIDKEMEEKLEDILALYRAVSTSIHLHTYPGVAYFPEKEKNFRYSIGPLQDVLEEFGVDSLVFVYGFDEISTGGRQALMAASIIIGAFTGVYMGPRAGVTFVSVAVVDSSGDILWYDVSASSGEHDLRNPETTQKLFKLIFADFPQLVK